eukprot:gene11889-490_t
MRSTTMFRSARDRAKQSQSALTSYSIISIELGKYTQERSQNPSSSSVNNFAVNNFSGGNPGGSKLTKPFATKVVDMLRASPGCDPAAVLKTALKRIEAAGPEGSSGLEVEGELQEMASGALETLKKSNKHHRVFNAITRHGNIIGLRFEKFTVQRGPKWPKSWKSDNFGPSSGLREQIPEIAYEVSYGIYMGVFSCYEFRGLWCLERVMHVLLRSGGVGRVGPVGGEKFKITCLSLSTALMCLHVSLKLSWTQDGVSGWQQVHL